MTVLEKEIERAWWHRLNGEVEECLLLTSAIRRKLGLPAGVPNLESISPLKKRGDDLMEALLLSGSLYRAQGREEDSKKVIALVETMLSEGEGEGVFSFYWEKGLTAFSEGDYTTALDDFLSAHRAEKGARHNLAALMNALLCMENLGLPYERTHKEVTLLLSQCKRRVEKFPGVESQLEAFQLRRRFRKGELKKIFVARRTHGGIDQSSYYRLWISKLPYHRFCNGGDEKSIERVLLSSAYFYQKGYRLRTLQGILHPDDLRVTKPSEWVDRFYLWVWGWLADAERFPLQRVMSLLDAADWEGWSHRLTVEDTCLLRNGLLWLSLFDSGSAAAVERLLRKMDRRPDVEMPLLELEKGVIHYFLARRDGKEVLSKDCLKTLEQQPLWKSEDLYFRALVEWVNAPENGGSRSLGGAPWLGPLVKNLQFLLSAEKTPPGAEIAIDMRCFQMIPKVGKRQISEAICLALECFKRAGTVSCEDLLAVAFGISRYEPLAHDGKIFNLLARMRTIFSPMLSFRVKSGFVVCEGDWSAIHFLQRSLLSDELKHQPEWRRFVHERGEKISTRTEQQTLSPLKADLMTLKGRGERVLTRREVEALVKRPRSTVNRLLNQWEREGRVRREGRGRNTRYWLNDALSEERDRGGVSIERGEKGHA